VLPGKQSTQPIGLELGFGNQRIGNPAPVFDRQAPTVGHEQHVPTAFSDAGDDLGGSHASPSFFLSPVRIKRI
jgi:hypothetical protein